ncbi:MAG: transketolase family protein [Spirochaetales bacterium]|jgi:transketolase|nr:transketolase family protein [Spirochaetales bacterium]
MAGSGSVTGKAQRQVYGETLVELGKKNANLVVFDADVSGSTRSCVFAEAFPERFFNVGIAEMNMASMAAGISTTGYVPFINTFACFIVLRCADPIRSLIAYTGLNVKIVGTYSGLSDSFDGASHHSTMDINFMRAMPNMTILSPADGVEAALATEAAFYHKGPVYLRMHRNEIPQTSDYAKNAFEIGRGVVLREGKDVSIIATGFMVHRALAAADSLASAGISARVVNIHTIKPIDKELIIKCAAETKGIVTAEEHSITGGLGSAVAEVLAANKPAPVAFVGVENTFTETGDYESLLKKYGLTAENIVEKAKKLVQ